jgi:hypothetical protein
MGCSPRKLGGIELRNSGRKKSKKRLFNLAKYDNSYGRKSLLHAKLVKITRLIIGFLVDL